MPDPAIPTRRPTSDAYGEADDRAEIPCGLFASQSDALEALEPPEALLDPSARLVERLGEEGRRVLLVGLVRDHRGDAASPGGGAIGLAGIAFVAQCGAWGDVRPYVEQGLEAGCVGNLAAGQIERDDVARIVRLGVDFGREPATRASERLALLPPFAPAAETWARTMVELKRPGFAGDRLV